MQDLVDQHDELPDLNERLTTEDTTTAIWYGDIDDDNRLNETEFKNAYNRVGK